MRLQFVVDRLICAASKARTQVGRSRLPTRCSDNPRFAHCSENRLDFIHNQPPPLTLSRVEADDPASKMRLSVMRKMPSMPAGPASDATLAAREVTPNSA
jgi:hypothetical protein